MAKDLSIIIPCRNELSNLMFTLQNLYNEFNSSGIDYEIIVVLNQCSADDYDFLSNVWLCKREILKVVKYNDKPSCWQARNVGCNIAIGDYILFLDAHVLSKDKSLLLSFDYKKTFKGGLHYGINYFLDNPNLTLYQYNWQPDRFWGTWSRKLPDVNNGYKIISSGIAGLMIDSEIFHEIGGFNESLGIYGGGESYIDLKIQMFGYDLRCNPSFQIYHLALKRNYAWNNNDFRRNFLIASYALGGERAMLPVYLHFLKCCSKYNYKPYIDELNNLKEEAVKLAEPEWQWIQKNARYSLFDVLSKWGINY